MTDSHAEINHAVERSRDDGTSLSGLSLRDRLDLTRWHIDRYDRLRASASSRAAVVLSAGAILTAGNAVIFSQLLQQVNPLPLWLIAVCTVGLTGSASLVILAIIRATGVLVSLRLTRDMFPDSDLPPGLIFNATDTVRHFAAFASFQEVLATQNLSDVLQAASVELWIIIKQHRHRYARMRSSVRALRRAAVIFIAVLAIFMIANLIIRLN